MKIIYSSLLCCLILSACTKGEQVQMADTREESIQEFYRQWFGAMENEDIDSFLSLLGDDFYLKSPTQPPTSDTTKLRKGLKQYHDMYKSEVDWEIEDLQLCDNFAVVRVKEANTLINRQSSDTTNIEGIHMALLQKNEEGRWKLHSEVSSLNQLPAN